MFDPTLPLENTAADAAQMRSQLTGLKALIDAILTVTAAQVDGVTTLPSGTAANATVSVVGNTMHFTFGIPQGQEGLPGEVTQEDLDNASMGTLSQTSNNSNGVAMLGESADSSYNQPQMQNLMNKMDELINALRR